MRAQQQAGDIELYIDRLVLHGFPRADRYRIGEAIRQELQRQFGEGGFPAGPNLQDQVPSLNAGIIQAQVGGKPEHIGVQVAQAIYGSVTGQHRRNTGPAAGRLDQQRRVKQEPGSAGQSGRVKI